AYYKEQGRMVMALNSKDGKGIKQLVQAVRKLAEPKLVKWRAKGLKSRSVRTIILGIPNVGKSTLINRLAGRNATKTADKPGETKGKQWVHLADNLDLLDTPGVLWPKLEEQKCARRLAATGAISDTVYDMEEVVADLITTLSVRYSEALKKRFKLFEIDEDTYKTIEHIGRNRGAVLPGNRIDMEKTYKLIIKDFREGHIGPISLDMPEEFAEKQDG
ncbi:MAG: ribosome biogenesis GTPase YlqF, partial [Anaeroglobus sp.]